MEKSHRATEQHRFIEIEVTWEDIGRARQAQFLDLPEACRCPIRYALERLPWSHGVWTVASQWALSMSGTNAIVFDEETVLRIWRWDRYGEMEPFTLRGEYRSDLYYTHLRELPAPFTPEMMKNFSS